MTPRVLVLAGLEPAGRAGLLADLETIRALGGEPIGLATALTAQSEQIFLCEAVSPHVVRAQLRASLERADVDAVKIGVVPTAACLGAIREELAALPVPIVVDPVVRTSKGEPLSELTPDDYATLANRRTVLCPNVPELEWLGTGVNEADRAARWLERGFRAVVVKGGHRASGSEDVVYAKDGTTRIGGTKLERGGVRGTGCRHASALAVELARGASVGEAASAARQWVASWIEQTSGP